MQITLIHILIVLACAYYLFGQSLVENFWTWGRPYYSYGYPYYPYYGYGYPMAYGHRRLYRWGRYGYPY